ncbi:DUF7144 family membrane protein [Georgenia sp. SUBG003]|uniref:DUF7144 family membrane protein n=1 Tax=Georgenia sp. SUBG003 TaxID=1497974 RepID=UPI003AB4C20E
MATQSTAPTGTPAQTEQSSWAMGLVTFAGVVMLMMGAFHAFVGFIAVIEDEFFVVVPGYALTIDATTWGWIHMGLGALVLLAGVAVLSGQTWGRVVGVVLAVFSAFANFMFIPYYPLWSLAIIALDILVIWALATAPMTPRTSN